MAEGRTQITDSDARTDIVEVGPTRIEYVPLARLIALEQMRETYSVEGMKALSEALADPQGESDNRLHVKLIHPPIINQVTRVKFVPYLAAHNDYYGTRHSPDDFLPDDTERYLIMIGGHRRRRSVLAACQVHGIDPEVVWIRCSIEIDKPFHDTRSLQSRENTYDHPSPAEDARAIRREFDWRIRQNSTFEFGRTPYLTTHRSLADFFGCGPDKISAALRYTELPQDIQEEVEKKTLAYGTAVLFYPLVVAAMQKYRAPASDERVIDTVLAVFYRFIAGKFSFGKDPVGLSKMIDSQLQGLAEQYETGELFELSSIPNTPEGGRRRAEQTLAATALGALEVLLRHGAELPAPLKERLGMLAVATGAISMDGVELLQDPLFS